MNVNATVGDDGKPHVTAIEGHDQHYDQYGRNGLVWIMTPPLYYAVRETSTSLEILISDSKWTGFSPMPGLLLPDGTERACMLHAKYVAGLDANGKPTSWSGIQPSRDFGCQNDYIDRAAKLGKGYSGLTSADAAYIQIMLMMKWATTNSDVLGGMFNHFKQATVTKGESNAHRVIVSTADAAGFDIDNYVNVGTDGERNNTGNHSVAECRRIIGKTVIDDTNTALDLDGDAITTINPTGNLKDYISVMPYRTGATDRILGTDGIPHGELDVLHQPIKLAEHRTVLRHVRGRTGHARQGGQGLRHRRTLRTVEDLRHHQGQQDRHHRRLHAHRKLPRLHRQDLRPMAVLPGPLHRRRHPAAGRHRGKQRHRPVRRRRRRSGQTARHQDASALRLPLGRRALRRVLLAPRGRSGPPRVGHRGPPVCAWPLEGVDESGGGERSEGADAPSSLPPRQFSGFATASLRTSAFALRQPLGRRALRRVLLEPQERSGQPQVEQRGPPIWKTNNTLRRNYPPPPARGPATAT